MSNRKISHSSENKTRLNKNIYLKNEIESENKKI